MTFLREVPLGVFLFALMMVALLGGVMIVAALWARRNAQAIRDLPPTGMSALTEGRHLVWGRVSAPKLKAPLTGRPCAWWQVEVWESRREKQPDGKMDYFWTQVRNEQSQKPLRISDGEAECGVDAYGATLMPSAWSDWRGDRETPTGEEPELLTEGTPGFGIRHDVQGTLGPRFRYVEQYIWHDAPIFVLGEFAEDASASRKRNAPAKWLARGPARADGGRRLPRYLPPEFRAFFARLSGPPFIVSTRHPKEIVETQELGAKAGLPFGLAFAALGAFMVWGRYFA
ncbi:hypothetical protein [Bosea sp. (in: a-proteobacteria)]|uniref:hypothetical protein n=1 Tax=Bosea sp. (in: a-proteobacteria) TaxID=1871050 RepID=UPI0026272581|nr:hypothetical protein [Bosea sp. (in: a-proteobacteria)]MCO5093581.1 hypothetical protein [Bosea sp. (in: a-proteobacteria)]